MAESALKARTPFGALAVPGRHGAATAGEPAIVVAERPNLAIAQVSAFHGERDAIAKAIADAAGLDLPSGPKRVQAGNLALVGLGQSQWLVFADGENGRAKLARLGEMLSGLASVVDQSDAKAILRLSGPRAGDVLAKGCSLDLHPRVFAPGDFATTQVALIPCQLWQLDVSPTFELSVPLSYAGSFWSWLDASATEFGYEVRPALDGK